MTTSAETVVRRLIEGVGERRWAKLPDLYADPTDVRHPLAAEDVPLRSRSEIREHFEGRAAAMADRFDMRPDGLVIHQTVDPEMVVAEFTYRGSCRATGLTFSAPCVFVVRVRDGRIVESRDYIDEAAFRRAAEGGRQ